MGLDNRDYARENFNSDRGGWGTSGQSNGLLFDGEIWKKLIAANIVVFLLQIFFTRTMTVDEYRELINRHHSASTSQAIQVESDNEEIPAERVDQLESLPKVSVLQQWLQLDSRKVLRGQIWRLVTCGFCHDRHSIWHLLINMIFVFWFGRRLEQLYGSREFTAFYFTALLVASFAFMALDLYTSTTVPAIGASGAVWGIVALYAMLYPYEQIYIYFLFPVQIRILALIYFLFDLHPVLLSLAGERYSSGVGHAAHVGGAVFGFLYWKFQWRLSRVIGRLSGKKQPWANSHPGRRQSNNDKEVILKMPERSQRLESADEEKMDTILAKISREGRDSLTDDELRFLENTSQKLRDD